MAGSIRANDTPLGLTITRAFTRLGPSRSSPIIDRCPPLGAGKNKSKITVHPCERYCTEMHGADSVNTCSQPPVHRASSCKNGDGYVANTRDGNVGIHAIE
jgi:hypothetical protein